MVGGTPMKYGIVFVLMFAVVMAGCVGPLKKNLPPAQMLMHPGPGVDGPGPGVMQYQPGCNSNGQVSQVEFVGPDGMQVRWDVAAPGQFDSDPLVTPARYNFSQGAIYRLKLSDIPGREGVDLYPTLEVGSAMPRTAAFLSHNAIPVQFTEEDFDQVTGGNFVTKVIYLPDPEFQELALAGVETLVSTRLDPGVDPIVEADRRGAILGVVRLGNKDLEAAGGPSVIGGVAAAVGHMPVGGMGAGTIPSSYISGGNGPQYGMPTCGTPIGLPGPPHIPLGVPAGLQKHVVKNHTLTCIPKPTKVVRYDVAQVPGMGYPKPANHATILEVTRKPLNILGGCATGCEGGACAVPCAVNEGTTVECQE
jgi:hypothetical protein